MVSNTSVTAYRWVGGITMPYKISGSKVLHYKNGKWSVKQNCSSHEAALAAVRLLHGVEHGMKVRPRKKG